MAPTEALHFNALSLRVRRSRKANCNGGILLTAYRQFEGSQDNQEKLEGNDLQQPTMVVTPTDDSSTHSSVPHTLTHHSNSSAFLLLAAERIKTSAFTVVYRSAALNSRIKNRAHLDAGQLTRRPQGHTRTETRTQAPRHQLRVVPCCGTSHARALWEPCSNAGELKLKRNQLAMKIRASEEYGRLVVVLHSFRILRHLELRGRCLLDVCCLTCLHSRTGF